MINLQVFEDFLKNKAEPAVFIDVSYEETYYKLMHYLSKKIEKFYDNTSEELENIESLSEKGEYYKGILEFIKKYIYPLLNGSIMPIDPKSLKEMFNIADEMFKRANFSDIKNWIELIDKYEEEMAIKFKTITAKNEQININRQKLENLKKAQNINSDKLKKIINNTNNKIQNINNKYALINDEDSLNKNYSKNKDIEENKEKQLELEKKLKENPNDKKLEKELETVEKILKNLEDEKKKFIEIELQKSKENEEYHKKRIKEEKLNENNEYNSLILEKKFIKLFDNEISKLTNEINNIDTKIKESEESGSTENIEALKKEKENLKNILDKKLNNSFIDEEIDFLNSELEKFKELEKVNEQLEKINIKKLEASIHKKQEELLSVDISEERKKELDEDLKQLNNQLKIANNLKNKKENLENDLNGITEESLKFQRKKLGLLKTEKNQIKQEFEIVQKEISKYELFQKELDETIEKLKENPNNKDLLSKKEYLNQKIQNTNIEDLKNKKKDLENKTNYFKNIKDTKNIKTKNIEENIKQLEELTNDLVEKEIEILKIKKREEKYDLEEKKLNQEKFLMNKEFLKSNKDIVEMMSKFDLGELSYKTLEENINQRIDNLSVKKDNLNSKKNDLEKQLLLNPNDKNLKNELESINKEREKLNKQLSILNNYIKKQDKIWTKEGSNSLIDKKLLQSFNEIFKKSNDKNIKELIEGMEKALKNNDGEKLDAIVETLQKDLKNNKELTDLQKKQLKEAIWLRNRQKKIDEEKLKEMASRTKDSTSNRNDILENIQKIDTIEKDEDLKDDENKEEDYWEKALKDLRNKSKEITTKTMEPVSNVASKTIINTIDTTKALKNYGLKKLNDTKLLQNLKANTNKITDKSKEYLSNKNQKLLGFISKSLPKELAKEISFLPSPENIEKQNNNLLENKNNNLLENKNNKNDDIKDVEVIENDFIDSLFSKGKEQNMSLNKAENQQIKTIQKPTKSNFFTTALYDMVKILGQNFAINKAMFEQGEEQKKLEEAKFNQDKDSENITNKLDADDDSDDGLNYYDIDFDRDKNKNRRNRRSRRSKRWRTKKGRWRNFKRRTRVKLGRGLRSVKSLGSRGLNLVKNFGSRGLNLVRGLSTASTVAEGVGTAEAVTGAVGATEAVAGAAGAAEGAGAVAALASNPIGWAVAGGLALGAIGYGLYHLSIDDDSEDIMDKLEKSGAVEHNYWGNSKIKDWSQVVSLNSKELDALKRFDDWSKQDKKTLEDLSKLNVAERSFILEGLKNENIRPDEKEGGFTFNKIALDRLTRTDFWNKDKKNFMKIMDKDTIKLLEESKKEDQNKNVQTNKVPNNQLNNQSNNQLNNHIAEVNTKPTLNTKKLKNNNLTNKINNTNIKNNSKPLDTSSFLSNLGNIVSIINPISSITSMIEKGIDSIYPKNKQNLSENPKDENNTSKNPPAIVSSPNSNTNITNIYNQTDPSVKFISMMI